MNEKYIAKVKGNNYTVLLKDFSNPNMDKLANAVKSKKGFSCRISIYDDPDKLGLLDYPSKNITITKKEYQNPGSISGGTVNRSR